MHAYDKDEAREKITALVEAFRANEKALEKAPEAQIENDFIRPLFEALNWNVQNKGLSPTQQEFRLQRTDRTGKRPDYILHLDGRDVLVMDAKQVKYSMHDPRWLNQVYSYSYSTQNSSPAKKIDFAILTDFQEFIVLDCTLFAARHDAVNNFRVFDWTYNDYVTQFDTLWELFERNNVLTDSKERKSGLWSRYLSPQKVKANRITPDKAFLAQMDDEKTGWRVLLAKDMKKRNPSADGELITAAVQLWIDRLIFVKALSDREVDEDYLSQLEERVAKAGLDEDDTGWFKACRDIFESLNNFYNGSIFKSRPELEAVSVSNKVVRSILRDLQPENSPYNFAVLPVEILGTIYERFLGRVVRTTDKQVRIEDKPEVRKAGGVYYTPQYIVDYIVKNTVGRLLVECKTPADAAKLKVLDPACGSGSFLLGAYSALIEWHREYYARIGQRANLSHKRDRENYYVDENGEIRLTAKLKREILKNNIYGVDIDPQAVEVTIFSLSLKALEDLREGELTEERTLFHQTVLPDLSANIKNGNSLIGTDYFSGKMFPDMEEMKQVKPFDWDKEFPEIMGKGGFDAVIGNPPYLNVDDTWGKGDSRLAALKASYPHIYNDKTDVLFYFMGKATELCKGRVGFIVSRAFLEAYKADKLREHLVSHSAITQIVDFRNFYIFSGVGITTCIIIFQPGRPPASVEVYKLRSDELPSLELSTLLTNDNVFEHIEISQSHLTSASWALTSLAITSLNVKIDTAGEALDKILIIGQGMQTGRNDVFGERTQEEITKWRVKPGQFYKRASNSDIQRYFIRDRGEYILYPQAAPSFDKLPADVQKHLLTHADELKKRAAYQRGDCEWWKFTWPLHEEHYGRKRIICPYLATFNRFALDEQGEFLSLTDTTVLFENRQPESLLYLLGVLNSKLLTFRFRSIGKLKSGGIFEYFWNSISKLPIRRINFTNPAEKSAHDRMVSLVEQMLALHKAKAQAKTQSAQDVVARQIRAVDEAIDKLVYELYGLTEEEIKIVEGG